MNTTNQQEVQVPRFTHILVGNEKYCNGVGVAHMIGTYAECVEFQVVNGLADTTHIEPF